MPDAGIFGGHRIIDNTIEDIKLQQIVSAGKVANSATTATDAATASAIIARDANGRAKVADPSAATDIANKQYVDAAVSGVRDAKDSCRVATTANLAATRAANVLTASANGALAVDGVSPAVGERVLVKNQTTGADNGIYTVTDAGSAGTPFVLTRAADADTTSEVSGGLFVWVTEGTTNADTGWLLTTNDPITLNTTSLAFVQFSSLGQITAGNGLAQSGSTLSVNVDNSSIEISADTLQVKALGITAAMLAGSIPDSKLNTISTAGKVANSATTATDAATASAIIARDANGRAKVADPSAATDIANKQYVDNRFVAQETPSGPINGSNVNFTLANAPSPAGSLELYVNGLLLLQGTHYSLSGVNITFTTNYQPQSGEWLRASYTKA